MFSCRKLRRILAAGLLCAIFLMGVALGVLAGAVWPMPGETTKHDGKLTVDISNAAQGYVMAKAESKAALKLRVTFDDYTYTYDLNGDGEYEVFPLQFGSGKYYLTLYRNVKSNKFTKDGSVSVTVEFETGNEAFLCPSQYVNYTPESPAVLMAQELCANLETDKEKVQAIRDFIVTGFTYDYVRATTQKTHYLGDVDMCYETRMGLCQDLACTFAAMLRSQGIPTQLVLGYADKIYHAWNNVLIDGEYVHMDVTGDLSGFPPDVRYTAERVY